MNVCCKEQKALLPPKGRVSPTAFLGGMMGQGRGAGYNFGPLAGG